MSHLTSCVLASHAATKIKSKISPKIVVSVVVFYPGRVILSSRFLIFNMASEEQKIGDVAPEFPETAETSEKNDDSNRTLAEEVQQNEYQMYQRSQKHLQEIEEEVRVL